MKLYNGRSGKGYIIEYPVNKICGITTVYARYGIQIVYALFGIQIVYALFGIKIAHARNGIKKRCIYFME